MKQYRLLKDLPGLKKGTILSEGKSLFGARTLITKNDVGPIFISNDLTEDLFEEIKEPTDSIHWKPKEGERCWSFLANGEVVPFCWSTLPYDLARYELGNIYRTEKECEKARDRKFAEVRLRRTSTFKPDFENNNSGYVVYYDFRDNKLDICSTACCSYGERVHYETKEEAEKSIKENEKEWLIYFGVKKD